MAVDDEEEALELLRVVLQAAGAEVFTATSGSDALRRLAETKPDGMVVDLGMPQMDGLDFIARIRASSDATSGTFQPLRSPRLRGQDRTKALERGFEMHLAKPVDPGELFASIATLVRRRSAAVVTSVQRFATRRDGQEICFTHGHGDCRLHGVGKSKQSVGSAHDTFWDFASGHTGQDDVVMVEVVTDTFDREWRRPYAATLAERFGQDSIHVRAISVEMLDEGTP